MAKEEAFVLDAAADGIRLDKWLAGLTSVGSREKARRVLKSGKVTVDGAATDLTDAGRTLRAGARVAIRWNQPGTGSKWVRARDQLDRAGVVVLHQDESIVVVDKPSGLLTDAADAMQLRSEDTLRKRVDALGTGDVWPAHRIDRNTTGVVVFVRTAIARAALKRQWIAQRPERIYLVVVEGRVSSEAGMFSDDMAWDAGARLQRPCRPDAPGAWRAQANYQVLERFGSRATLLEVSLITGRRNQIRLHAMLAGHPLIGEPLYRLPGAVPAVPFARQALHARRLVFDHPTTGEEAAFEAPVPADIEALLQRLRRG